MRYTFEVITLDWEIAATPKHLPEEAGIYQCYGDSPIYGGNSLLYIGQSTDVRSRVAEHLSLNGKLASQNGKSFRFARCPAELLTCAESILICTHKPSMNAEFIDKPSEIKKRVLVENHGERGVLALQVTNIYWVH